MSRKEATAVNITTPISVYPINSNKAIGVYHGHGRLIKDGFEVIITNYIATDKTKKNNLFFISNHHINTSLNHTSSMFQRIVDFSVHFFRFFRFFRIFRG